MLNHLDSGVGSMVDLLEQLEILDNTIIFFAGDNGYSHWGYFGRPLHKDDPLFKNKGPWPKGSSLQPMKVVCEFLLRLLEGHD